MNIDSTPQHFICVPWKLVINTASSHLCYNPFRTAVPYHMWGQTTQILSSLSPKRDCGSKGVNPFRTAVPLRGQITPNNISSSFSPKRDCGSEESRVQRH